MSYSGLAALADFPTRGNSILDNCLTNKSELYDQPFLFQALIRTDHGGDVLPPWKKFKTHSHEVQFQRLQGAQKNALFITSSEN